MDGKDTFDIYMKIEGLDEIRTKVKEIERLVDVIEKAAYSIRYSPVHIDLQPGTGRQTKILL